MLPGKVTFNSFIMMRFISFILFLFLLSSLMSCKTDAESMDDTIHVRIEKDPERLHPLIFPNSAAREIYQYIFLPLADYNSESLELEPLLITKIPEKQSISSGPFAGGIKFDIEIRPEAVWEDGSPITAKDYIFSLKAIRMPLNNTSRYRDILTNIAAVEEDPSDPKKFSVIMYKDDMNALELCIQWEIYPAYFYDPQNILERLDLSKLASDTVYEKQVMADSSFLAFAESFNGLEYSSQKISGSGPYKFTSWESNQYLVLEKKQDYWGTGLQINHLKNNPDKIVFHMIPDDVAAMVQLKEGNIDIMNNVDDDDFLTLQKDETYKDQFQFFSPSLTKYYVILLNNKDPKLNDKKVRRALAHLVDVDHILNKLENGFGQRLATPVHPSKSYYHKDLKPIPFSLENAQSLLADAGWKDTNNDGTLDKIIDGKKSELVLDMYVSGQELGNQVALLLQQNAQKVGIKINMIEKEFKAVRSEHIKTRNYHLVPSVVSTDLNTWDDLKTRYHSEFDNPSGANETGYYNVEADNILTQIPAENDLKKRAALYKKLQEIIYDDQPMIYLFVPAERIILNKIWKGNATQKRPGYAVNQFEMIGKRATKK